VLNAHWFARASLPLVTDMIGRYQQ